MFNKIKVSDNEPSSDPLYFLYVGEFGHEVVMAVNSFPGWAQTVVESNYKIMVGYPGRVALYPYMDEYWEIPQKFMKLRHSSVMFASHNILLVHELINLIITETGTSKDRILTDCKELRYNFHFGLVGKDYVHELTPKYPSPNYKLIIQPTQKEMDKADKLIKVPKENCVGLFLRKKDNFAHKNQSAAFWVNFIKYCLHKNKDVHFVLLGEKFTSLEVECLDNVTQLLDFNNLTEQIAALQKCALSVHFWSGSVRVPMLARIPFVSFETLSFMQFFEARAMEAILPKLDYHCKYKLELYNEDLMLYNDVSTLADPIFKVLKKSSNYFVQSKDSNKGSQLHFCLLPCDELLFGEDVTLELTEPNFAYSTFLEFGNGNLEISKVKRKVELKFNKESKNIFNLYVDGELEYENIFLPLLFDNFFALKFCWNNKQNKCFNIVFNGETIALEAKAAVDASNPIAVGENKNVSAIVMGCQYGKLLFIDKNKNGFGVEYQHEALNVFSIYNNVQSALMPLAYDTLTIAIKILLGKDKSVVTINDADLEFEGGIVSPTIQTDKHGIFAVLGGNFGKFGN